MREAHGAALVVATAEGSGSDALLTGTLALSEDSCWGVEQPDGSFLLVIWPSGTTPGENKIVTPPPGGEVALGEPLRLSGGEASSEDVEAIGESCAESSAFRAWEAAGT